MVFKNCKKRDDYNNKNNDNNNSQNNDYNRKRVKESYI